MEIDVLKIDDLTLNFLTASNQKAIEQIKTFLEHPSFEGFMGLGAGKVEANEAYIQEAITSNATTLNKSFVMSVAQNNTVVGVVDVLSMDGDMDLGYFIDPEHQGKHIVQRALVTVVNAVFNKNVTDKLVATTHPENPQSIRVLENLGFMSIGTKARDYDDGYGESIVWGLTESKFRTSKYFLRYVDNLEEGGRPKSGCSGIFDYCRVPNDNIKGDGTLLIKKLAYNAMP